MEGGGRRPEGSLVRAAYDCVIRSMEEGAAAGVLGTCVCGLPLLGPAAGESLPQATAFRLALPDGELTALGSRVRLDDQPIDVDALTPAVHAAFLDHEVDATGWLERLFAGGLLGTMMVPVALWCVAVMVVITFYRQWATYGVPVGP